MINKFLNYVAFAILLYFIFVTFQKQSSVNSPSNEMANITDNISSTCKCDNTQAPKGFIQNILYSALKNQFQSDPDTIKKFIKLTDSSLLTMPTVTTDNKTSKYRIFKLHYKVNSLGQNLYCGDSVKIYYNIFKHLNEDSILTKESLSFGAFSPKNITSIKSGEKDFIIGASNIHEFNIFTDNEKIGSELVGIYNNFKNKEYLEVKILDGEKKFTISKDEISIFDSHITSSSIINCQDLFSFKFKIYSIKNGKNEIYSSQIEKYCFYKNDNNLPLAFRYILSQKPYIGTRTVILPAKYLKELSLNVNKNEFLMVEIFDTKNIPSR